MSDSRWAIRIDKGDGSEMDYTAQEALERIRPHYKDFEAIKEYFFAGHVINTPFAYYKLRQPTRAEIRQFARRHMRYSI